MKNTSESKKSKLWGALPAAPYVLWMVAFIVIPLGMVVFFALTRFSGTVYTGKYRARRRIHERFAAFDQTGGNRDRIVCVDCLSAGLYPFQKTGISKTDPVYHGHAANVDELFAENLCMDDHSGK